MPFRDQLLPDGHGRVSYLTDTSEVHSMSDEVLNDNHSQFTMKLNGSAAYLLTPEGFEGRLIQIALPILKGGIVDTLQMNCLHSDWPL